MAFKKLRVYFLVPLLLVTVLVIWGCGNGGSDGGPTTSIAFKDGASVSIVPSGNGKYVVQGDNLSGVAGVDLSVSYDSATMSSPTVTLGDLFSGSLFAANPANPIRIAIVSSTGFSGSGEIATISFATDEGAGEISIEKLEMINSSGRRFQ